MEIIQTKVNPKALNLEGLENMSKKVTVGFKCHAKLKLQLAGDAKKAGLTLSEYIEALIQEMDTAMQIERNELAIAKERTAFYENDILQNLFKQYESQIVKFVNSEGDNIEVKISEPKDIYTVLINSYKAKK
jgi:septum formation topological specificity factor MinE